MRPVAHFINFIKHLWRRLIILYFYQFAACMVSKWVQAFGFKLFTRRSVCFKVQLVFDDNSKHAVVLINTMTTEHGTDSQSMNKRHLFNDKCYEFALDVSKFSWHRSIPNCSASIGKAHCAEIMQMYDGQSIMASINSFALNGLKSSIASPMPIKRIGIGLASAMAAITPPLAVPSSLLSTRPVTPSASSKVFTWVTAF